MQTIDENNIIISKKIKRRILPIVFVVLTVMALLALLIGYQLVLSGARSRYLGIKNVSAEKVASVIKGAEMNANNIFNEVGTNLNDPESVVNALKRHTSLNLDVRGYFAAFVPGYFPEKGTWFEPYIYQPDYGGFEYRQVGSARHNYTKSPWFIQAQETGSSFWSDPYYYYDGTSLSGHYCTFVKPLFNEKGDLACVCGADMKFEWLVKELKWVDESSKSNKILNKYQAFSELNYYTVLLNNDGACLAHPEEKELTITDENVLKDLQQGRSGVATGLDIDGETCVVYYGPVEFVNWSIAVIVPLSDILKPMLTIAIVLMSMVIFGMLVVWFVCKRI